MNINDIIKLINAGYSKADIEALTADQPDTVSKADPVPDSKPDNTAVPDTPDTSTVLTSDDPVMKELAAIKQQMQKLAISSQAADIPDEKDALAEALKKLIGE